MPALNTDSANWRKSSRSAGNGACIEVGDLRKTSYLAVRDSQDRSGPALVFTSREWHAFVRDLKDRSTPARL
jgi:hypothetical protein